MKTRYRKLDRNIFEKTWQNKDGKGKTLYFKISVKGTHVHCNAYDPDNPLIAPKNLSEARVFRDKIKTYLNLGQPAVGDSKLPPRIEMRFREFVEKIYIPFSETNHRTHAKYLSNLNILNAFFGDYRLDKISPFDIERFKAEQMKRVKTDGSKLSGNTIRIYLACLSNVLHRAVQECLIVSNPCLTVAPPEVKTRKKRRLGEEEEERLLTVAVEPLKSLIILILELGARPLELLAQRIVDIDWNASPEAREIKLTCYKANKRHKINAQPKVRWVPITDRAWEEMCKLKADAQGEFLLPYTYQQIHYAWRKACKDANITNFCPRWLRDEAASRWADAGMGPFEIASLLGHSDVRTSMIYVKTSRERLRSLMSQRSKIVAIKKRQA